MSSAFRGGLFRGGVLRELTVASIFFVAAIALSGLLPLWLDEIIQLRETRNSTPAQLIASLPRQPGAAPLGYLVQQSMLRVTGYSVRWARFPSAVFVAGVIFLTALIAGELGLARSWLAAAVFALFPVTLRYACESRIYSQALLWSTLAVLLFIRLSKRPGTLSALLYGLALTAAVYTQPFAVFVGFSNLLWAAIRRERRIFVMSAAALTAAVAAFLPWYFWTKAIWQAGIIGAGLRFTVSPTTPLMLFRELPGAGYWGSGLLVILCAIAFARRGAPPRNAEAEKSLAITAGNAFTGSATPPRNENFLILWIFIPVTLALAADAAFGYFVATRQIIWVLPAVAVFAALALERSPRFALPIAALLAVICIAQSVRYFTTPREDWQAAANVLSREVQNGACLVVVPPEQQPSFAFFRPELANAPCPSARTVVAFTPYATNAQRERAVAALAAAGYAKQHATEAGKSNVSLFTR